MKQRLFMRHLALPLLFTVSVMILLSSEKDSSAIPLFPDSPATTAVTMLTQEPLQPVIDAKELFQRVSKAVFLVKTSLGQQASKTSYGSGFAIGSAGLIATNYHVVAQAVQKPKKYKLFVQINEAISLEAKVMAIDVIHDLALIKVDKELEPVLDINPAPLLTGEKLFSVGQPADLNMAIVEGNYNGTQTFGPYEQIVLSSPINSGMSGGPTLSSQGQVVGINVAILRKSQNISFAIPARHLSNLTSSLSKSNIPWNKTIQRQLASVQEKLSQDWLGVNQAPLELKEWRVMAPPPDLKCWQDEINNNNDDDDDDSQSKAKINVTPQVRLCKTSFAATPTQGLRTGYYEISYYSIKHTKNASNLERINNINEVYKTIGLPLGSIRLPLNSKQTLTRAECHEKNIVNSKNTRLHVNICTSGIVQYNGLNNTSIKIATLDGTSESLIIFLKLDGFDSENTKKILNTLIESVGKI